MSDRRRLSARNGVPQDPRDAFPVEAIEQMVHGFYASIRDDAVLGPIFESRIDAWPDHLERMVRFWRAVLRSEPVFSPSPKGAPPQLHRQIDGLTHAHFDRWLALFAQTVEPLYDARAAGHVMDCARRIATTLSMHLPPRDDEQG